MLFNTRTFKPNPISTTAHDSYHPLSLTELINVDHYESETTSTQALGLDRSSQVHTKAGWGGGRGEKAEAVKPERPRKSSNRIRCTRRRILDRIRLCHVVGVGEKKSKDKGVPEQSIFFSSRPFFVCECSMSLPILKPHDDSTF